MELFFRAFSFQITSGEGGIRTPVTTKREAVFETAAFSQLGHLSSSQSVCLPPAEGEGLEPPRAKAQRFSRPPPYQLGLALQTPLKRLKIYEYFVHMSIKFCCLFKPILKPNKAKFFTLAKPNGSGGRFLPVVLSFSELPKIFKNGPNQIFCRIVPGRNSGQ